MNPFDKDLDRRDANYVPLSPLSFLPRTAALFAESTAVVHGRSSYTWSEAYDRCRRLASALAGLGVGQTRSEEHTSELQSRGHLVCRLLLEKKKKTSSVT